MPMAILLWTWLSRSLGVRPNDVQGRFAERLSGDAAVTDSRASAGSYVREEMVTAVRAALPIVYLPVAPLHLIYKF